MKIDLHMHSKYSVDGQYEPQELIAIAKKAGLSVVALADHDTMLGVKEMIAAGEEAGIKVIPAIELTGQINGNFTHILGLNVDPESAYFSQHLRNFEELDRIASKKLIRMFQTELNMDFEFADMEKRCEEAMYPLVPLVEELTTNPKYRDLEIVQPYINNGPRSDVPTMNFFWDHCCKGGRFYIPYEIPTYKTLIEEIHQEGGLAIIAHPYDTYYRRNDLLELIKEAGADGLECYSNYHDAEMKQWYHDYAINNGLLISGGSDFHGDYKPTVFMGEFGCDDQDLILGPLIAKLLK